MRQSPFHKFNALVNAQLQHLTKRQFSFQINANLELCYHTVNNESQSYFCEDEVLGFLSVIIDHELLIK